MELKSGYKSSEFFVVVAYAAANYLHIDVDKIITAITGVSGVVTANTDGVQNPVVQILVGAFVLFRMYMKSRAVGK